ncbi:unnamed protein product [Caenorhabditis auriculariae]|uniref:C-type lectin domain-containing protein n=1 Tax=Caenorhabditis auriculariae TaxID=2777116 RepID=A0A8S1H2Z1_9PELO|nr:unnamed protein product [Caenorhabditis auriculariae]
MASDFSSSLLSIFLFSLVFVFRRGSKADVDPCPDRWFHMPQSHSCFYSPLHPHEWEEAEEHCIELGGHLASVRSPEEASILRTLLVRENPSFFNWIGLRRNPIDQEFSWTDGSSFSFALFKKNEPTDFGDCIAWSLTEGTDGWAAINCDYSQFFLCRKGAEGERAAWFSEDEGEFSSPGFPEAYENEMKRNFFIQVENGSRILLTFTSIDTEPEKDVITVFDGHSEESRTIAKLSGKIPESRSFLSSSHEMAVRFESDEDTVAAGFSARYSILMRNELKNYSSMFETISSPKPAASFYLQDYLIECPPDFHVEFTVSGVQLDADDTLKFYQGSSDQEYVIKMYKATSSKITNFPTENFKSTKNTVFFSYDSGQQTKPDENGWKLEYQCKFDANLGEEIEI